MSQRLAAVSTYFLFVFVLLGALATLTPFIISTVTDLATDLESLLIDLETGIASTPNVLGVELQIHDLIEGIQSNIGTYIVPGEVLGVLSNVSANATWVLVTFVTLFYLLLDWHKLRDWAILQVPPYRRSDFLRLYVEIKTVWQAYLRGQLVLMLVVGLTSWLGAAALGLRSAWAIGILAGLLDVVPTVGPAIAAVIGMTVAWFTGSTYLPVSNLIFVFVIGAWFGVVQGIENIWLRPRILGNSLRMHQAFVFIGVMGSLALAGVFVTLIIVPLMGTVGVLWHYLRARMLDIDPWPDGALDDEVLINIVRSDALEGKSVVATVGELSGKSKKDGEAAHIA